MFADFLDSSCMFTCLNDLSLGCLPYHLALLSSSRPLVSSLSVVSVPTSYVPAHSPSSCTELMSSSVHQHPLDRPRIHSGYHPRYDSPSTPQPRSYSRLPFQRSTLSSNTRRGVSSIAIPNSACTNASCSEFSLVSHTNVAMYH
jgi:hypothetical protein